jgi:preprotein translocase subunit YajC
MSELTTQFHVGDRVTADGTFTGTVVEVLGDRVIVENSTGDREQFGHHALTHTNNE